ncbi:1-acylglycerol-3-phosphate O [Fistulina hepatica ATCC 64428]|uniref:1-acyl-sn-glycerol-3-phosphate acyltransferase n=1 Tax=Fistulina hepatica ATCC 64428 TaxID=1128425 RepID=A0A0D7A8S3_9AGAR|nr:1-acylglycerol-3-phosphate O [Fistulina hepatica ATCC 64428]
MILSLLKAVAYLSLPVVVPSGLRYYARAGLYLLSLGLVGTASTFIAAVMAAGGDRFSACHLVARTFYLSAGSLLDLSIEIDGAEWLDAAGPAIIMNNHQSMLDVLVVGRCMPRKTSILSKRSILFTPLGLFMTLSGCIFIDRANFESAKRSLNDAAKTMRDRNVGLWIFPEGTRHLSNTPGMLPFKKGGFHVAVQAGLPILPIVTENYWHIYHKGVFTNGVIRIKVLPPIPTTGLSASDVPDLVTHVRDCMLLALKEISTPVQSSADVPPNTDDNAASASDEHTKLDDGTTPISRTMTLSDRSLEDDEDEGMVMVRHPDDKSHS